MAKPVSLQARTTESGNDVRALLSARQREIMDLVARGLTNKEIAQQLGLTDGTVKQHLAAIFPKLGVRNRTWAVSMWHQAAGEDPGQSSLISHGTSEPPSRLVGDEVIALPGRLVASVAVSFAVQGAGSTLGAARLAGDVISTCRLWAEVFEGALRVSSPGCVMIVFGYPQAHLDDVSRAVTFAETVRQDLRGRLGIDVRIAIDAAVDELCLSAGEIVGSQTAWNSLTLAFEDRDEDCGIALTERARHLVAPVHPARPDTPDWTALFARAPFINEAERALALNRASWFSVESWPPMPAKLLLDAWRSTALAGSTRQIVLRMPSGGERDVAQDLLHQLRAQLQGIGGTQQGDADLGWWLHALAQEGPLSVVVYGWNEAISFASLLGDAALDELARCPVIFLLGPLPIVGNPRLVVRSLDARGRKPLVGRVHEIVLPEPDGVGDGHSPDIVALLDQIDTVSKAVLGLILQYRRCTAPFLAHQLDTSGAGLEWRLDRLVRLGLISLWPDGSIRLRDARTERTVGEQLRRMQ